MKNINEWIASCVLQSREIPVLILLTLFSINHCSAQLSEPSLSKLSSKQWSGANGLISNEITSSVQAQSGFLWITSDHGLMRFDGKDIEIFNQQNVPLLKTGSFEKAFEDKYNTLWFTSHSNGVVQFKNDSFYLFPQVSDKRLSSVHSLLVVDDHTVWVGTTSEGLFLVKDNLIQSVGDSLMRDFAILDILTDNNNNLWIATDGNGLIKYDGVTLKQFTMSDGLNSNFVNTIAVTRNGEILVGTSNGLNIISHNQIESHDLLEKTQINSIKIDLLDRIWIGTDEGLIRIFPSENKLETVTKESGFPYSHVSSIDFDHEGNVWVSTLRNGLIQINDQDITHYLSENNFPGNKIIPSVYLRSFQTDKLTFTSDSDIVIKPGNNRYTFNYISPSLAAFSQVQFKYRLENVDRFWVSAGTKHQVEYTNLSPGSYTFHVIASIDGQTWTQRPATITFYVSPFFYQTKWFLMLIVSLVVLMLFAIFKWRVHVIEEANKELRKVNGELDRFIYSASHDLRSPLTSMLGLIALARVEEPDVIHNYIGKIEGCVKMLDKLTRDIKDFASNAREKQLVEKIDFKSLIDECITIHQYLDGFNEFKWNVNINAPQTFYSDSKRIKIVLSNLISNSIKYRNHQSKESFVTIDVLCRKSFCDISISDNGIGIAPEHIKNIFDMFYRAHENSQGSGLGLYIVKETITKLHGMINVDSEPGKGTAFNITIPSSKTSQQKIKYPWQRWSRLRPMKMMLSSSFKKTVA